MDNRRRSLLIPPQSDNWPDTPIGYNDIMYVDCRILPMQDYNFHFGYPYAHDNGYWSSATMYLFTYSYGLGMNDVISRSYDLRTVMTAYIGLPTDWLDKKTFSITFTGTYGLTNIILLSIVDLEYLNQYTYRGHLVGSATLLNFIYFTYQGNPQYPLYYGNMLQKEYSSSTDYMVYILYLPLSKILRVWIPELESVTDPYNPYNDEARIIEDKNLDNA